MANQGLALGFLGAGRVGLQRALPVGEIDLAWPHVSMVQGMRRTLLGVSSYERRLLELDGLGLAGEVDWRRASIVRRFWGPLVSGSEPPLIQPLRRRMTMASRDGHSPPPMGTFSSSPEPVGLRGRAWSAAAG